MMSTSSTISKSPGLSMNDFAIVANTAQKRSMNYVCASVLASNVLVSVSVSVSASVSVGVGVSVSVSVCECVGVCVCECECECECECVGDSIRVLLTHVSHAFSPAFALSATT